jgi:hypothetical protein
VSLREDPANPPPPVAIGREARLHRTNVSTNASTVVSTVVRTDVSTVVGTIVSTVVRTDVSTVVGTIVSTVVRRCTAPQSE